MKSFREYGDDQNDSSILMLRYLNARDLMRKMTQTIDSNNEKLDCETLLFGKKEWLLNENEINTEEFEIFLGLQQNEKFFLNPIIYEMEIYSLSSRALEALKFLVQNDSYQSMKKLSELWKLKNYQSLANEIILYIRKPHPVIFHKDDFLFDDHYLENIFFSPHRTVINSFSPIETEANCECFYHEISIALIGNGSLATALRFATVAKIIEFEVPLKTGVLPRYARLSASFHSSEYIFKLKDFAFSAGVSRYLFINNINEIRFPEHLIKANLDPTAVSMLNYARTFHQFIVSLVTNRPIHDYGFCKSY